MGWVGCLGEREEVKCEERGGYWVTFYSGKISNTDMGQGFMKTLKAYLNYNPGLSG